MIISLPQVLLSQGMTNDGGWQYYHGVSSGNGLLIGTINGNTNALTDRAHILYRNTDGGKYFGYNGTGIQTTLINSQNNGNSYFNSGGNIGIGTASPSAILHVEKSSGTLLRLSNDANNYLYSGIDGLGTYIEQVSNTTGKSKIRLQTRNANQGVYSQFIIDGGNSDFNLLNGEVGIGTENPQSLLHVNTSYSNAIRVTRSGANTFGYEIGGSTFGLYDYTNSQYKWRTNGGNVFLVETSGSVGIGTTSFGTHKLAVEGSIGAREIKVEAGTWSDFVFSNDYELRTLEEVEHHIAKNGHLPEIPSESEVTENGINLGEMDAKLLQKIEELTLYMIQMNKRVNQLETENQQLREEVSTLKNE